MISNRNPFWTTSYRLAAVVCAWFVIAPAPAAAQSFFEQLFGLAKPTPVAPMPPVSPQLRMPGPVDVPRKSDAAPQHVGVTYRTVCVRACDGFFVPMSFATRPENFQQDQAKCQATCGEGGKLFVYRNPGEAIEEAVDLAGRPYASLPNAFRFRKTRVEGCSCRPPPWSEAEIARHQSYAAATAPAPGNASTTRTEAKETLTPKQATALALVARDGTSAAGDVPHTVTSKVDRRKSKSAEAGGRQKSSPPKVTRMAAVKPQLVQQPKGIFSQPKYVWPGD